MKYSHVKFGGDLTWSHKSYSLVCIVLLNTDVGNRPVITYAHLSKVDWVA